LDDRVVAEDPDSVPESVQRCAIDLIGLIAYGIVVRVLVAAGSLLGIVAIDIRIRAVHVVPVVGSIDIETEFPFHLGTCQTDVRIQIAAGSHDVEFRALHLRSTARNAGTIEITVQILAMLGYELIADQAQVRILVAAGSLDVEFRTLHLRSTARNAGTIEIAVEILAMLGYELIADQAHVCILVAAGSLRIIVVITINVRTRDIGTGPDTHVVHADMLGEHVADKIAMLVRITTGPFRLVDVLHGISHGNKGKGTDY
jgi:hypothetical protein